MHSMFRCRFNMTCRGVKRTLPIENDLVTDWNATIPLTKIKIPKVETEVVASSNDDSSTDYSDGK
jgi:hypothetical protein